MLSALMVFVMLVPDPDPEDQAGASYQCRDDREQLKRALSAYASQHNAEYPQTLQQLVPDQMDKIPFCRMPNAQLEYKPGKGQYQLSCSHHGDGRFDK